ncbi:D-2-hydroxyacid dehydrogenase [Microlunatus aurantiacus]|uniref:D-2-hydroxyacid dehydrogenase n=1 Tax=Microlunatus aurantiacus TaxID=446786 RepID=A0ABP7D5C9_9ACTN
MITFAAGSDDLDDLRDRLSAAPDVSGDVTLVAIDDEGTDLGAVEGAVQWGGDAEKLATLLARAPQVRWLHSPGAGVESWPLAELRRRQITLTNAAGVFAIPIAEWVLSVMLSAVTRAREVDAAQREHRWADDLVSGELHGRTLLLLGAGGIGQQVVDRAAAFGMRIWAASRSGRAVPGAERSLAGDAWRDALPAADVVVSTVPLTAQTRGLVTAADIARLRSDAWFVNVGRGGTVDEEALLDAAAAGRIGGAALDTWLTEPLPADHRAWALENVVVSPHRSGSSAAGRDRGLDLLADNIRRFSANESLRNVVDLDAGY